MTEAELQDTLAVMWADPPEVFDRMFEPEGYDEMIAYAFRRVFPGKKLEMYDNRTFVRFRSFSGFDVVVQDSYVRISFHLAGGPDLSGAHLAHPWDKNQMVDALTEVRGHILGWAQEMLAGCGMD